MKIISPSFTIITPIDAQSILQSLESAGRVCYKSESKGTPESTESFVRNLIKRGHESVLEHVSITVHIECDRGVSHELVRHRLASYSQESTRYCNYGRDEWGLTFIEPCFWDKSGIAYSIWLKAMLSAQNAYLEMLSNGASPQEARSVLPNSIKTEIRMTANLREWRHIFKIRALGTAGKPHPQMLEIMVPMLKEFNARIPVVFEDLKV